MPNPSPYYNAWDDTAAEQGDVCPESWGFMTAMDAHEELAVLEEAEQRERAVVRENTKRESAA